MEFSAEVSGNARITAEPNWGNREQFTVSLSLANCCTCHYQYVTRDDLVALQKCVYRLLKKIPNAT